MTNQTETTQMTAHADRLPMTLAAYVALVLSFSAVSLLWGWAAAPEPAAPTPLTALAFWFVLSLAAETLWLRTPDRRGMVSMSLAANIAALFVLPRGEALSIAALSVLLADLLLHRRGVLRAAFNAAQTSLSLALAGAAMDLVAGGSLPAGSQAFLLYPAAVAITLPIFCAANVIFVSLAIALESGRPFLVAWHENYGFLYHYLSCAALFFVGLGLVVTVETLGYVSGLVSLIFLIMIHNAYRFQVRRRRTATTPD
ncbi:MAG: hypothetical protein GF355_12475 [Candidatus Eisenbacteria bacterium]|nr:hypothetical protein [Candidatus Eisenbacteria bacterium]